MLKILIKKQFYECFRGYFINIKKGTSRSRSGTFGMFVLFAALMLYLAAMFFGLSHLVGSTLISVGFSWLYFVIMGIISIMLGTFGSVFNTYSTLYMAKDNELLLSMPIPPSEILVARMSLVYGLSLLYSGLVWLPSVIYYMIFGSPTAASVVFGVLLTFIIALFVTVITCALGWLVALLSSKLKNKSVAVVFLSLVFFAAYYFVCFKMTDIVNLLIANAEKFGNSIKKWGNLLYQLGLAADGEAVPMLIFTAVSVVLFALCFYILSKSFIKIVTKTPTVGKTATKAVVSRAQNANSALFSRELKRFAASPTYMLNCGIGAVIMLVIAVVFIIKANSLGTVTNAIAAMLPDAVDLVPLIVIFIIGSLCSMNAISTPSISLEGKRLWILRSMPVSAASVLEAKVKLHLIINAVPSVISVIIISICMKFDISTTVFLAVFMVLFIRFMGVAGIMLGLARPNFDWTNEAIPIKQSMNVLFSYLIGWAIIIAICLGAWFTRNLISFSSYMEIVIVVMALLVILSNRVMYSKGAEMFEKL